MNASFVGTQLSSARIAAPRASRGSLQVVNSQTLQGKVVSTSMDKTVTVVVERFIVHPVYNKRSRTSKTYLAHAPEGSCKMGDVVELKPVAPMSKRKRFAVGKVVEPSL